MIKAVTFCFGGTLAEGKLDKEAYRRKLPDYIRGLGYRVSEVSLRKAVGGMLGSLKRSRNENSELRFEELCAH